MLEPGEHSSPPGKGESKSDKKKQTILVVTGIAGVGLTYLLLRQHAAAATSPSTATSAPAGGVGSGGTTSGGADYSGAFNAIGSQLASLTQTQQDQGTTQTTQGQTISTQGQTQTNILAGLRQAYDTLLQETRDAQSAYNAHPSDAAYQTTKTLYEQTIAAQQAYQTAAGIPLTQIDTHNQNVSAQLNAAHQAVNVNSPSRKQVVTQ